MQKLKFWISTANVLDGGTSFEFIDVYIILLYMAESAVDGEGAEN